MYGCQPGLSRGGCAPCPVGCGGGRYPVFCIVSSENLPLYRALSLLLRAARNGDAPAARFLLQKLDKYFFMQAGIHASKSWMLSSGVGMTASFNALST